MQLHEFRGGHEGDVHGPWSTIHFLSIIKKKIKKLTIPNQILHHLV